MMQICKASPGAPSLEASVMDSQSLSADGSSFQAEERFLGHAPLGASLAVPVSMAPHIADCQLSD